MSQPKSPERATLRLPQDTELPALVRYWVLRLLVDFNVEQHFVTRHGFGDNEVARQIGLGAFLDDDEGIDCDPAKVRACLRKMYRNLKTQPRDVPAVLQANVQRIAQLVGLSSVEQRLFEFAILLHGHSALREMCEKPANLRGRQISDRLAALLELPRQDVWDALSPQARLSRSGLLTINRHRYRGGLDEHFELISDTLPDRLNESVGEPADWLRDMVRPGEPAALQWADYAHLDKPLSVLRPYLRQAFVQGRTGVNIFVYGPPGTGKTQLARLLAQDMGCELFEVTTEDNDKDPISGHKRVKAFGAANSFFARQRALILFDEVEEVFADQEGSSGLMQLLSGKPTGNNRKAWINQVLESNALPALWVANSLTGLDPAFARRFDMILEMPVPPRSHRLRMIRNSCGDLIDRETAARMAESDHMAPAVLARARNVVQSIADQMQPGGASQALQMLVNNTLRAQGHRMIARHDPHRLPEVYDPAFIHADTDLDAMARQLVQAGSGRLCLYGPPGTGKTAFGRWLAQQLDQPLIVRRASDLLGMYVGQTEKNMARAFAQAHDEGGVLQIDEVDSFLQARQGAQHSWEVSLVNEMLTQMEGFDGVFIASTNLMGQLDAAVLRRFDLKVKFDALRPQQAAQLLLRYCQQLQLTEPGPHDLQQLQTLPNLTPGDFATVLRQSRLRPLRTAGAWVEALVSESRLKSGNKLPGMGFISTHSDKNL